MNYLDMLEESYALYNLELKPCEHISRLEFISECIFGFDTYEDEVACLMAKKCLQVCRAINDRETFQYISTNDGNLWYLIMVNMPFLSEKIEWGTSIRGAWWDNNNGKVFIVQSHELYYKGEQLGRVELNRKNWASFIDAMISFSVSDSHLTTST